MHARSVVLILLLVVAAVAATQYERIRERINPTQEEAPISLDDLEASFKVQAIGYLAPRGGLILIASTPGERLEELSVKVGQNVADGDPLGRLTSYYVQSRNVELLRKQKDAAIASQEAQLKIAEARQQQAQVALESAEAQKSEDLEIKRQQVKLLENRYELTKTQLEKLVSVSEEDPELLTASELEKQRLLSEQARLEWEEAELALRLAPATADRLISAAKADLDAAQALVDQLKDGTNAEVLQAQIDAGEKQMELSDITSPISGVVLQVFVDQGESVTTGPVFQLADLSHMICRAEVYETDVKRVDVGQLARISSPAFSAPFDEDGMLGVVRRVGDQVVEPGLQNPNPLAPKAKHVVEVAIEILPPDLAEHQEAFEASSRLVDLQVDVEFLKELADSSQSEAAQEPGGEASEDAKEEAQASGQEEVSDEPRETP